MVFYYKKKETHTRNGESGKKKHKQIWVIHFFFLYIVGIITLIGFPSHTQFNKK